MHQKGNVVSFRKSVQRWADGMLPRRRKGRRRWQRTGELIQRRSYEAVKRNMTPRHFFFPAVKHCGKWDKGEVLTVLGLRWLTRLWLWLYHQMRQAVEMLTRSQMCQVQHFSHSLSRLQVKASSQNTVALSSHCTPTGDHCTPLKETFFHTVPGGPHLLSSLTVNSFGNRRTLLLPVSDEAVLARRSDFFQLLYYFIFDGINR